MCGTCGCHQEASHRTEIPLHEQLLSKNKALAQTNRQLFQARRLLVLNVLSSPGSGKTALIQRMAQMWQYPTGAIVGDLETENDAQRLRDVGVPAIQIITGTVCHLDAAMVAQALKQLDLDPLKLLVIENVGNLVCPALYDLGETLRVVLMSVTEGEDKPLKYPTMFKTADVVIVSKMDLADAVEFNQDLALGNIHAVAPQAKIFELSAKTGLGLEDWLGYLEHQCVNHSLQSISSPK